ncbi:MAG: DNA recombination protein RmuC [Pseudomonadota bacterium]
MTQILQQWNIRAIQFADSLSAISLIWITAIALVLFISVLGALIFINKRGGARNIAAQIEQIEHKQQRTELQHTLEIQGQDFATRSAHLTEQLGVARRRADALEDRLQDAQAAYHNALNERDVAQEQTKQLPILQARLEKMDKQLEGHRTELGISQSELSALTVRLTEERKAAVEKLKILEDAKERLSKEFEVLANRIFEDKSDKLIKRSKQSLETTLNPLREQLTGFRKKVEDVYDKETRERVSLLHEVNSLKELNQQMSADALNLTKALKGDNKLQGNWGELVLERVLEDSGLKKGREYELQKSFSAEDGQRRLPDVIVHLPDARDLVIDSKVSLMDYDRYCAEDDEAQKEFALQAHIQSMRRHVKSLSIKDYSSLEGVRTLDFVFVFVPIEPAFLLVFEHDQALFQEAYDRNIIVVSPTTLLATLRTVQNLWRYDDQNKNAEKIARLAGGLHDQFALVLESMIDMGRQLEKANGSFDTMMKRFSQGKGNLVNRTRELEKLGAKTKRQIPTGAQDRNSSADLENLGQENLISENTQVSVETLAEET